MEFVYCDESIAVCIKPAGVLSVDAPGGMPELVRGALGAANADIRTVHRLDRVVSGLMVLARNGETAAALSRQITGGRFEKSYIAVVHGETEESGELCDLLLRDKRECKTYVVRSPGKGVQEARLRYKTLASREGLSLVDITLITGRTHQIRCQFSSHGYPLVGDRKYGSAEDGCDIALFSRRIAFDHPLTGERMDFTAVPPAQHPWSLFADICSGDESYEK